MIKKNKYKLLNSRKQIVSKGQSLVYSQKSSTKVPFSVISPLYGKRLVPVPKSKTDPISHLNNLSKIFKILIKFWIQTPPLIFFNLNSITLITISYNSKRHKETPIYQKDLSRSCKKKGLIPLYHSETCPNPVLLK